MEKRIVSSNSMTYPKTEEEWKIYEERKQKAEKLRKQGICVNYS